MVSSRRFVGALALGLVLGSGCSAAQEDAAGQDVEAIEVFPGTATLEVGASKDFPVSFFDIDDNAVHGYQPEISWASSDPSVATVVAAGFRYDGRVTAVSAGTAIITASCCSNLHASVTVTVPSPTCPGGLRSAVAPMAMARADPCPATWALDSIVGASSGTWTDNGGTMVGALHFNPPEQVSEGGFYPVSTTFTATLTSNTGAALRWNIDSYLTDLSRNPNAPYDKFDGKFINANPSVTDSITTTYIWPVSTAVHGNLQTLILRARGDGAEGPPTTVLLRTAYYHKVTP